jgi:hypothetical protein
MPVSGLSRLAVAVGLAVALPAAASAGLPSTMHGGKVDRQREELRQAILTVRAIVGQLKSGRFCGPVEELRAAERTLERMEWAYAHHTPSPVKLPKPAR